METFVPAIVTVAVVFGTTCICVIWIDRSHKKLMREIQEDHEKRMAELRAIRGVPPKNEN